MELVFGRTRLVATEAAHLGALYELCAQFPESWGSICGTGFPSPPGFEQALWHNALATFTIVQDEDTIIGVVRAFDFDAMAGTAWIDCPAPPVGLDDAFDHAKFLLARYLVEGCRVRKIFATHYAYEQPFFSPFFPHAVVEGALADYFLHEAMYWDKVFSSLTRKSVLEMTHVVTP